MLTIKDATTGNVRKYATSDAELVNSLFNEGGGTLDRLWNIRKTEKAICYDITPDRGVYLWKETGLWGKYCRQGPGAMLYQHTLDEITLEEKES